MAAMAPPSPAEVTSGTCYRNSQRIPELGLEANLEYEHRVYALACEGGRVYVGIVHKNWLGRRMTAHFKGGGAFFTRESPPREIFNSKIRPSTLASHMARAGPH